MLHCSHSVCRIGIKIQKTSLQPNLLNAQVLTILEIQASNFNEFQLGPQRYSRENNYARENRCSGKLVYIPRPQREEKMYLFMTDPGYIHERIYGQ